MSGEKQTRKVTTKIATPIVGMDAINNAVRALYLYRKPAMYKDLATAANTSEVYLSSALSASRDVGLTTSAGKRGLYKLTLEGDDYATLLSYGKDSECKETLRKLITESPLWSEIVTFLEVSSGQERNVSDLVLDIQRKLGKKWSERMRERIASAYSSILDYAGLVQVDGGRITSRIAPKREAQTVTLVEEEPVAETPKGVPSPSTPKPDDFMDISYGPIFLRIPAELAGRIIPIVTEWMKKPKNNQEISGSAA
jgi:hypothetical protein